MKLQAATLEKYAKAGEVSTLRRTLEQVTYKEVSKVSDTYRAK